MKEVKDNGGASGRVKVISERNKNLLSIKKLKGKRLNLQRPICPKQIFIPLWSKEFCSPTKCF